MAVIPVSLTRFTSIGAALSARHVAAIGGACVLGLLAYPWPVAWLGLIGLLALGAARWRAHGGPFPMTPFTIPLAVYLAGAAIGLAVAIHPPTAGIRFFGLLAALATFALIVDLVRTDQSAHRLNGVALLVAVIVTPFVLFLVAEYTLIALLPEPAPTWMAALDPLRAPLLDSDEVMQRFRLRRSGIGALSAFGVALALGPMLVGPGRRARVLGALGALLLVPPLIVADNRGALLAIVVAGLLVASFLHRWLLIGLASVLVGAVAVLRGLVPLPTFGPLVALRPDRADALANVFYRTDLWDHLLYLMGDYRFTGVGLSSRSARSAYQTYFQPTDPPFSHAHNIFFQSYLEQGPLGLAGALGIAVVTVFLAIRVLRGPRSTVATSAAVSAGTAGIMLLLAGMTDIVPLTTVGMVLWFGALGVLCNLNRWQAAAPRRGSTIVPAWAASAATIAGLLAVVWVGIFTLPRESVASSTATLRAPSPSEELEARWLLNLGSAELSMATMGFSRPDDEQTRRLNASDELLRRALELDPRNLGTYRQLAATSIERSESSRARRLLIEADTMTPTTDIKYRFQLARLYASSGEVSRGIAAFASLGRRDLLILWGERLARRGSWKSAAQVFGTAIAMEPNDPAAYAALTEALRRDEGRDGARAALLRLAAERPQIPWPLVEVGELYEREGDHEQARFWYEKAAALAPNQARIRDRLAGL